MSTERSILKKAMGLAFNEPKNPAMTSDQAKRAIRNASADSTVKVLKNAYKGRVSFPEITPADIKRLHDKLDACADAWLADIVSEKA